MTEADMQVNQGGRGFDDYLISTLGGLVMGSVVWAALVGLVGAIKDAAPPGINLGELIAKLQITLPPSIDLSNVTIVIPLPTAGPWGTILNLAFLVAPVLAGLGAWVFFYRKLMRMD